MMMGHNLMLYLQIMKTTQSPKYICYINDKQEFYM